MTYPKEEKQYKFLIPSLVWFGYVDPGFIDPLNGKSNFSGIWSSCPKGGDLPSHREFLLRNWVGKTCLWKKYILLYE